MIIAFLSVIFLLRLVILTDIDASEAEARILTNRIFYSPSVISYYDPDIGRGYPGIIDFEKYKKQQNADINEIDTKTITYGQGNKLIAAKLTLENIEAGAQDIIFYNKENYEFWEPRILSTVVGGSGSVKSITEQRYVLIKNADRIEKGILKIQVIVRK
ncbi:hypothetical protein HYX05_01005 [Candidatus Woesearchaeota archaeon]|nr:hypothetical protein [Candidatus Woesearchaeota archaeon]